MRLWRRVTMRIRIDGIAKRRTHPQRKPLESALPVELIGRVGAK
jgi:hypothetical protein